MRVWRVWAVVFIACGGAGAQNAQQVFTDPLALLAAVASNYAHSTGAFAIAAVDVSTHTAPMRTDWQREEYSVTRGAGAEYRIESKSGMGSYLQVSDGTTEWVMAADAKLYTQHPLPHPWPSFPHILWGGIGSLRTAWELRSGLEAQASGYGRAKMLPQQTITLNGHAYRCYVVHVASDDLREKGVDQLPSQSTFWIDATTLVFRKTEFDGENYLFVAPPIHIPFHEHRVTEYPVMELHATPPSSLFTFVPPAGTNEIAALDLPHLSTWISPEKNLTGKAAPAYVLTPGQGAPVPLSAYRGSPVLVDLWATWCGPCLAAFPRLAQLASATKAAGLKVVTLDEDADAADATAYLQRHDYGWTNYHDAHHAIENTLGESGIPIVLLVNADGRVVFEALGADDAALRAAIAGLGPAYAQAIATHPPT